MFGMPKTVKGVRAAFLQNQWHSAWWHVKSIGLSCCSLRRILVTDLNFCPNNIQTVQELQKCNLNRKVIFAEKFLAIFDENRYFLENLWMSDEVHFHLLTNRIGNTGLQKIQAFYTSSHYIVKKWQCGVHCHQKELSG